MRRLHLGGIWGSAANEIWMVAFAPNTSINYWDGSKWVVKTDGYSPNNERLMKIWGSGAKNVWALGAAILRWDGTQWTSIHFPETPMNGIWGINANDVWTVGTNGTILHFH